MNPILVTFIINTCFMHFVNILHISTYKNSIIPIPILILSLFILFFNIKTKKFNILIMIFILFTIYILLTNKCI